MDMNVDVCRGGRNIWLGQERRFAEGTPLIILKSASPDMLGFRDAEGSGVDPGGCRSPWITSIRSIVNDAACSAHGERSRGGDGSVGTTEYRGVIRPVEASLLHVLDDDSTAVRNPVGADGGVDAGEHA